jgi:hypothetical protein
LLSQWKPSSAQHLLTFVVIAVSFLNPTHLIGPGDLLDENKGVLPHERPAFSLGCSLAAERKMQTNNLPQQDFVQNTMTRIRMGRIDPLSTFSLMLQVNEFFQNDPFAFFQCVARFIDRESNTLVTRVFSHRLAISKNGGEFLDAVDEEVVAVVLGKEAIYRSMYGREIDETSEPDLPTKLQLEDLAYDSQRDLDATIQRVSGAFRLLCLEQGRRG